MVRDGIVIFEDQIASLRRFKDDVREVAAGYECGIGLEKFTDIRENDILEAYEMVEVQIKIKKNVRSGWEKPVRSGFYIGQLCVPSFSRKTSRAQAQETATLDEFAYLLLQKYQIMLYYQQR